MDISILNNEKDIRHFDDGATIFDEGDPADGMYAVLEGSVNISVGGEIVESGGPGTIFGEMALIDGRPRSARVVAAPSCKLARIDERRFMFLVQQTPFFALQVMRALTERILRGTKQQRASLPGAG